MMRLTDSFLQSLSLFHFSLMEVTQRHFTQYQSAINTTLGYSKYEKQLLALH